jgi:hypothetical protein
MSARSTTAAGLAPGSVSPAGLQGELFDQDVLDSLVTFVRRFVVMTDDQACAVALWVVHTHCFDAAEATPYLHVCSPMKRSGKSRLIEVCALLVRRPRMTSNVSSAALFRTISEEKPTLLLDEVDTVFGGQTKGWHEELRSILNAGYRPGSPVVRCVGEGARVHTQPFEVFCPKLLAGIGNLPDTIADRSLPIRLQRRATDEPVERFRIRRAKRLAEPLREACEQWATEHLDHLAEAEPELPDVLDDRAQDAYEPLIAIADAAGGDWPARARTALTRLRIDSADHDDAAAARMLADIRTVFTHVGEDRLFSKDLAHSLAQLEDAQWNPADARPPDPRTIARLLAPFGVRPRTIRIGDRTNSGYRREEFADSWRRYLSPPVASPTKAKTNNSNTGASKRQRHNRRSQTQLTLLESNSAYTPDEQGDVGDVGRQTRDKDQADSVDRRSTAASETAT